MLRRCFHRNIVQFPSARAHLYTNVVACRHSVVAPFSASHGRDVPDFKTSAWFCKEIYINESAGPEFGKRHLFNDGGSRKYVWQQVSCSESHLCPHQLAKRIPSSVQRNYVQATLAPRACRSCMRNFWRCVHDTRPASCPHWRSVRKPAKLYDSVLFICFRRVVFRCQRLQSQEHATNYITLHKFAIRLGVFSVDGASLGQPRRNFLKRSSLGLPWFYEFVDLAFCLPCIRTCYRRYVLA